MNISKIIENLNIGNIGVMASDTIYGVFGKALDQKVVERIYELKERESSKPFIILINDIESLKTFGIEISDEIKEKLQKIWPNKVTVILNCNNKNFEYIHRGTNKIAFRSPKSEYLHEILNQTGPLVSTSANLSGQPYAKTIEEAKNYFGNKVDFYVDSGYIDDLPSTLIEIQDESINILREGSFDISNLIIR